MRSFFSSGETCPGILSASVPGLWENGKAWILANPAAATKARLSSNSAAVSPGNPTITSVVTATPGIAARTRSRRPA
jgi:hypothetical protein